MIRKLRKQPTRRELKKKLPPKRRQMKKQLEERPNKTLLML
jgi:hypothetical protein